MIFIILYNFGNSFFYDCPECNTNIGADYMHYGNNRQVFPAVDYYVGVFENEEWLHKYENNIGQDRDGSKTKS